MTFPLTALFVPADRPDRFAKALCSGADCVILDLEDAVAPAARPGALAEVVRLLASDPAPGLWVRVPRDPGGRVPLHVLAALNRTPPTHLLLPKAESAEDVGWVSAHTDVPIVALIESPRGVLNLPEISAHPAVGGIAFGGHDFAAHVGTGSSALLDQVRGQLVLHASAAGLPSPLDSPMLTWAEAAVVTAAARRARDLGMGGMFCIHPAQIPAVASGFRPDADELAWARSVVAENIEGAHRVGDHMVDAAVVARALRLIERYEATAALTT